MSILFEDRSNETPEQAIDRRIAHAGHFLFHAAVQVSEATPEVGLNGLALALGLGAARLDAPLEEVLAAVRRNYETAKEVHRASGGPILPRDPADA